MIFQKAPDIQTKLTDLIKKLNLTHIDPNRVIAFRSQGSKSKARARIWSFPRIWQQALNKKPHYCIEVLSEKFDSLAQNEQTKVLIHELLHIPNTFSGALLNHRSRGRKLDKREVEKYFKKIR